jgi:predicted DNA-binding transcriptional regulator AlpA
MAPRRLVTTPEVADYLNISHSVLRKWRMNSYGPPSYQFGTAVRYDMAEVRRWAKQQVTTAPTDTVEPITVDPDEIIHVLNLIDDVTRREDETPQDVIERVRDCTHPSWDTVACGAPGDGTYTFRCFSCGVSPELAVALRLEAQIDECGHELTDSDDWALLEAHVESYLIGEGTFRSCELEMDDWNTDPQDDPAESA